jgi:RNA polymerase sigma factor (sigma-70 family)
MLPSQWADYKQSVLALKERYAGQIDVHLGLECEYYAYYFDQLRRLQDDGCEYFILGCHFLYSEECNPYIGSICTQDDSIRRYAEETAKGIRTGLFSYVAHPDLYMMGRSKALNYLRRRKFFSPDPIPENIPQEISLEEQFLLDEQRRELHAALKQLPEDMATALYLVYFEDLSYADTAKVMKKTSKQVDNLLYRGKAALRNLLGKDGSVL